ncbi:MAG: hypothetical protein JRJ42_03125 [Deltaproteobacteria bacterium]|nr:hypothetical protein [Deltaproteobacteria bacterium]MBW2019191.1 hypothetical protein [Deltaproteobacteria bacterium]MBW2073994.1 hypothetical protein [Deltaproteobacteria bacterium]
MTEPQRTILYWPKGWCFWRPRKKYGEGYLLDGKRHGKWIFWYRSGQKQLEGEYIKGKKTGTWVKWDERGEKITEGEFLHGKMHGKWTDWYLSGQKALESHWFLGKRDGKWTYWNMHGDLEKIENYDHRFEEDKGYSIHTDLETKEIAREIQKENIQRNWEMLVGRFIGRLVKPWHIACWVLVFIPAFGLINAKTPWRSTALAGIVAFGITSFVAWASDSRK